jgi:hypothetical protein
MKKCFLTLAFCAAAISLCAVVLMNAQGEGENAQGRGAAATIPQLPFHLVENFFHYPANSVVGRTTGVAINPKTGNIVTLNRALLGRGLHNVRRRPCCALRSAGQSLVRGCRR